MRIKKAKVKNRSVDSEFEEKKMIMTSGGEMIETSRDVSVSCHDLCADSLIDTFDLLKPHAVLIADVREAIKVEDAISRGVVLREFDLEELKTISITGFVIVGNEEDGSEGIMIILQKKTGTRVLNITTPAVKFEDPDYAYCGELKAIAFECIQEVEDYLNGKVAVKQLEMNFDEGFDSEYEAEAAKDKKPKKKDKKSAKAKIEAFSGDDIPEHITEHQEVA